MLAYDFSMNQDSKPSAGPGNFGLPRRREEINELLAELYANDFFNLEVFESRAEAVQNAVTISELEDLISDIPERYRNTRASALAAAC